MIKILDIEEVSELTKVYNISVAKNQNYFVSMQKILVHNK